jgi:stage V sporulation protein S
VAGAIAGIVREHHRAEVQAIGAGAVNQAVKALILATGYLRNDGIFVTCVPEFADVTIEDKVKTAIKLVIEPSPESDFSSLRLSSHSLRSDLPQV